METVPFRVIIWIILCAFVLAGCNNQPASHSSPVETGDHREGAASDESQAAPANPLATAKNATPENSQQDTVSQDELFEIPESEIIRELVIDQPATLYFHSGKHYRPPFRLIQTDDKLILESSSGSRISRSFPRKFDSCPDLLPTLPENVMPNSTWVELDKQDFREAVLYQAHLYCACRYRYQESAGKFTEYVRSLPFVEKVQWSDDPAGKFDPATKQYLRIVSKAGDERHMYTSWWDPQVRESYDPQVDFQPPTVFGYPNTEFMIPDSPERLAWVKEQLDRSWDSLAQTLSRGSIYIFEGGTYVRDSLREPPLAALAAIGEILQQKSSAKQRSIEIMRLLPVMTSEKTMWEPRLKTLIEHYDSSPEMQEWFRSIQQLNSGTSDASL